MRGAVAILEENGTQWGVVEPITSSYGKVYSVWKICISHTGWEHDSSWGAYI